MATITKIEVQQKNKSRYNIYLDKEFAFGVDEHTLIRYMLQTGKELTELEVIEIRSQEEIRKAYLQAVNYLSYSMRSAKDVYEYLVKKEQHPDIINEVVKSLIDERYINDLEYGIAYTRTHSNISKKGPVVIDRELKLKGISDRDRQICSEEYSVELQIDNATALALKKLNSYRKLSKQETKQKLETMLVRKGYPFSVISIAIESLELDDSDEQLEALKYQFEKYHRKYKNQEESTYRQKMKQSLYRKGFAIEMIEKMLNEYSED